MSATKDLSACRTIKSFFCQLALGLKLRPSEAECSYDLNFYWIIDPSIYYAARNRSILGEKLSYFYVSSSNLRVFLVYFSDDYFDRFTLHYEIQKVGYIAERYEMDTADLTALKNPIWRAKQQTEERNLV